MKLRVTALLLCLTLPMAARTTKPTPEVHSNCCLCSCAAADETKCSTMCIRLQHSRRIIEEPEMNVCTKTCKRHGVRRTL